MSTQNTSTWKEAVATSGHSYLVHRFEKVVLSQGTGHEAHMWSSKCKTVAVNRVDASADLVATSTRCKRCFK